MNSTTALAVLLVLLLCFASNAQQHVTGAMPGDAASHVDPFIGTGGHGHTFPGATVPFGMVQCSPDAGTSGWDWCSGYHATDTAVAGFSHTHLSGTGCGDLGDILLLPALGLASIQPEFRSPYSHRNETATPGYYSVHLDNDIAVELSATPRCGIQKYRFPVADSVLAILDLGYGQDDIATDCRFTVINDTLITGYRFSTGWAVRQRVYFAMTFSPALRGWYTVGTGWRFGSGSVKDRRLRVALHFGSSTDGNELLVRTGISAVSEDGALANLRAEAPHTDFELYRSAAHDRWNRALSVIRIEAQDEEQQRTFMTAMYHCMIVPGLYQDVDGRYRGGDDEIHTADGFENATVFSLWDTYRALHPLFTIIDGARVSDWVQSMLHFQRESGLLPVWTLHANETNCMIGYHAVPVIADALLKGIGGFDAETALAAMQRSAEQVKGALRFYHLDEDLPLAEVARENSERDEAYEDIWGDVEVVCNGFDSAVDGATIDYHSSLPDAHHALITRATDEPMPIRWLSAPAPALPGRGSVVFAWQAGMSRAKGGKRFTLTVNGKHSISFNTPHSVDSTSVRASSQGMELRFAASMIDEFGDLFGTMLLKIPVSMLEGKGAVHLLLDGERGGSNDWVMTFTHSFASRAGAINGHGVGHHGAEDIQFARLQYEFVGFPRDLVVTGDAGLPQHVRVYPGHNSVLVPIRKALVEEQRMLEVRADGVEAEVSSYGFTVRTASAPRYIPADVERESVSKTLEYAFDDWCIARVAERLGKDEIAGRYDRRAQYFRALFDPDLGFMRGRNLDGSWRSPFNARYSTLKQHEYTEGNAWQYSWYVPQDIPGLIDLHGGARPFAAKLDSLFSQSSDLEDTGATGDVSGLIGLYAHGNEPSHHIAYLYNQAGQPWKTQALVRRIMREMYTDRRDGLSGNEDCGQMSAWYVLSAMGLYPVNPCGGVYEIGSPMLKRAEISVGSGRYFIVEAENNGGENVYVQSATLNGTALQQPRIMHDDIMRGGTLRLLMGPQPSSLWTAGN